jgi:hypothetical protein
LSFDRRRVIAVFSAVASQVARAVVGVLASNVRELVFVAGLAMLFIGLRELASVGAALTVVGCLLIWLAIPPASKRGRTP